MIIFQSIHSITLKKFNRFFELISQILKIEYFSELAIPIAIVIAATIRFIMIWIYEKSDHWIKEGLL